MDSLSGVPDALEGLAAALVEQAVGARARARAAALRCVVLAHAIRVHTGAARAPYLEGWAASLQEDLHAAMGIHQWAGANAAWAPLTLAQIQRAVAKLARGNPPVSGRPN
jgi:hypothetical protein